MILEKIQESFYNPSCKLQCYRFVEDIAWDEFGGCVEDFGMVQLEK